MTEKQDSGQRPSESSRTFIVRGRVTRADAAVADAIVEVHDVEMRGRKFVARTRTDRQGAYEVRYAADQLCRPTRANLVVTVVDAKKKVLGESATRFNAGTDATIDVSLAAGPMPAEYDRVLAAVEPTLCGVPLDRLTEENIAFVSAETALDPETVTALVASARAHLEADAVAASIFFALFRQRLPATVADLLTLKLDVLIGALERSAESGIVALPAGRARAEAIAALTALKAQHALRPAEAGAPASLGDLLTLSRLAPEKQDLVAALQAEHGAAADGFWEALEKREDVSVTERDDVRLALRLGEITDRYLPLAVALRERVAPTKKPKRGKRQPDDPIRALADLTLDDWKAMVREPRADGQPIGAPAATAGATEAERLDVYAGELHERVERAFPTLVLARRVASDTGDRRPFEQLRAGFPTFLERNPAFELGAVPIDRYIEEDRHQKLRGIDDPDAFVDDVRRMQRVFNITPRYEHIRVLVADQLDGAARILQVGPRRFVENYAQPLGGPNVARDVYLRAEQVHVTTLAVFLRHSPAAHSPLPYVIGGDRRQRSAQRIGMAKAVGPNLPTLFGALDLCDCEHCKSLYSPAAYLVDILRFLGDGPLKDEKTPLQILFERRPDLQHLELTCENTTTELPYIDLVNEILEASIRERMFEIPEGTDIAAVLATLRGGTLPASFPRAFADAGFPLTADASFRPDRSGPAVAASSWIILDRGWAFTLRHQGTNEGFRVEAWPQTSWTAGDLRAHPEHTHAPVYVDLRRAVYPWNLPLNLPVEEMRTYLRQLGVPRHELMRTFFRGAPDAAWSDPAIANEHLGLSDDEMKIVTGVTTGAAAAVTGTPGPWDFWGLAESNNDIVDPTDPMAAHASGDWDVVLQRVSIFLRQSGLRYDELLELLGMYFINPRAGQRRTFGIRAAQGQDPATCALSKLEIQVDDTTLSDPAKKTLLIGVWNRIHRFVRLYHVLKWTARDLDKAIAAFAPRANGQLDLTSALLVQLSHVERLRAEFNLSIPTVLSWWASMDAALYRDQLKEHAPVVAALYAELFDNKAAAQSLPADPAALSGTLSANATAIAAAFQLTASDLALLLGNATVGLPNATLNLENLSRLHRHATLARSLKLDMRGYLALLELIGATPFADTAETLRFVREVAAIRASGFSIDELDYLLRHQIVPGSNVAISDDEIAEWLDALRGDLRAIAAANTFVDATVDADAATADPKGELLRSKLALLNWDSLAIDVVMSALSDTLTYAVDLRPLPANAVIPPVLRGRLTYDAVEGQLRFTGTMSATELAAVTTANAAGPFLTAVGEIFAKPKQVVRRHLRRFSVPRLTTGLNPAPADLAIPEALKRVCYYDAANAVLVFVGVMTENEKTALTKASADPNFPPVVQALFDAASAGVVPGADVFLTNADADALFDNAATRPQARFLLVLRELLPHLRVTLSERAVTQSLGSDLQLDSTTASALLMDWMNAATLAGRRAMADFIAPAFADASPSIPTTRGTFGDAFATTAALHKVAAIVIRFKLTTRQLGWLFASGQTRWLDLRALPSTPVTAAHARYTGWSRLADLVRLRDALPRGEELLAAVFAAARATGAQIASVMTTLAAGIRWDEADLRALSGATGFNLAIADFTTEGALLRLAACLTLQRRLGATAASALEWTRPALDDQAATDAADDMQSLVRAKTGASQWPEAATKLRDPLRERQRSALVSYLLAQRGQQSPFDLYENLLIDVEMTPCMTTSRLKQAISSVQMFVQRSLMNLEAEVALSPDEAREWSTWRKQYRVWEANRKIFLYPENWIEPELRDDKSPFYKELESELLQSDLNLETAEDAFLHYLERLDEVARLEIVGIYREVEEPKTDVLHVIGRTYATPHVYFYRRLSNNVWSPWQKVDLDLEGDHIIPVIWNRRLQLFWTIFMEKSVQQTKQQRDANEDPVRYWEIKLAWSQFRDGRWSPKRISGTFLRYDKNPEADGQEPEDFSFRTRVAQTAVGPQLAIDCYGPTVDPVVKATPIAEPPPKPPSTQVEYIVTFVKHSPDYWFAVNFTRVGGTPLESAEIADITLLKTKAGDRTEIYDTIKLNAKGESNPETDKGIHSDSDFYLVSKKFSVASVSGKWSMWGGLGVTVEVKAATATSTQQLISEPTRTTQTPKPVVHPMQGIGEFRLDGCHGDMMARRAAPTELLVERITPTRDTVVKSMMFVEAPGEHTFTVTERGDPMMDLTPGTYRMLVPHQSPAFSVQTPFFYQDGRRTYLVSLKASLDFAVHFHPYVCDFIRTLNRDGVSALLKLENQRPDDGGMTFRNHYGPQPLYFGPDVPHEDVDFADHGAYSVYNWELFFHTPFLIAIQLSQNQRFEDAQKWFHFIFDPTATDSPARPEDPGPERFWRTKPFYDEALAGIETLSELFANDGSLHDQVLAWQTNPFKPHVVARTRHVAYMKAVVMRYLDNLIAWGDQLFRRDTIESINEATQLYVLAANILGKRPERIPPRTQPRVQTFRTLDDEGPLDSLSNALSAIEAFLAPSLPPAPGGGTQGGLPLTMPYFCLTGNDKLLAYWDTVADRLMKIRQCQNIEGVQRALALFEPPIDPALLVRAAAAGVDLSSVLADLTAAVPSYRYDVLGQKASELCNDVQSLGSALLAALEKRDAEALALLRSSQEIALLQAARAIKAQQIEEAVNTQQGLEKYQDVVTARQQYYSTRPFINALEQQSLDLTTASLVPMGLHAAADVVAAILHLVPNAKAGSPVTMGVTYGGGNVGAAIQAYGSATGTIASMIATGASLSATLGGHRRRQDDWTHQTDLATKELEQIEKQIAAAAIRVAIAEKELANHDVQVENAKVTHEFMRDKFTNQALYAWMVGQVSGIYFQSYQLAYDLAKRAERAYRHELGLKDSNFVQFGHWDSLKKGLLAGERLHHELRRMDVSFLDLNKREYEITKHVSINALDPIDLLRLKRTQECFITLPEALFDLDHPGHYLRRLKSVSVTIPCVSGPYASVNCTLTQLGSTIRHGNTLANGRYGRGEDDRRFTDAMGAVQSIVTSTAQDDAGLFETNLRDDRFLPFEGRGAISSWRLQLPKQFPSIDYETISDVILHLRYTAREGGDALREQAETELAATVNAAVQSADQQGLARAISLRQEFPSDFHRLLNPPSGQTGDQRITIAIDKTRFPFLVQARTIALTRIEAFVKVRSGFEAAYTADTLRVAIQAGATPSATPLSLAAWNRLLRGGQSPAGALGNWTLAIWRDADPDPMVEAHAPVDPNAIEDIVLVCGYTV